MFMPQRIDLEIDIYKKDERLLTSLNPIHSIQKVKKIQTLKEITARLRAADNLLYLRYQDSNSNLDVENSVKIIQDFSI